MVYGHGIPRTLEAALALWRTTEKALRDGESMSDERTKSALDTKLAIIGEATSKIATTYNIQEALEEMADAGAKKDAGAKDASTR